MSERHAVLRILKCPKSDVMVMAATFFLTVVFDLTVAIQAGLALSFFLFIKNLSQVTNLNVITGEMTDESKSGRFVKDMQIPEGVEVFEIRGPLFFGVASTFLDTVQAIKKNPKVRILRMRHVLSLDATALEAIKQVHTESRKRGICFLIADLHSQPLIAMQESGLLNEIGEENVPGTLKETIEKARALISSASAEKK
jgi:SulP family sulfate permease